jgi:hypothetical protein
MSIKNLSLLFLLAFSVSVFSQDMDPSSSRKDFEEKYAWRITQTNLAGQYIPKDLPDAINELNKLTDEASRAKFRAMSESDAEHKLYFSLGRWVATNWSLYEGSRMSHYLKEVGISFPEDQAGAVILAWHRSLNKKDLNFREIRDKIVAKRKKEREDRLKNATILKEEIKKPAQQPTVKN